MIVRVPYTVFPVAYRPEATYHKLDNWLGYTRYLQAQWNKGAKFINLEHDVIATDSQLQAIWDCKEPWCTYPYEGVATVAPMFGCVKFSSSLIAAVPDVWKEQIRNLEFSDLAPWQWCDSWFYRYIQEHTRVKPHFHTPAVINCKEQIVATFN